MVKYIFNLTKKRHLYGHKKLALTKHTIDMFANSLYFKTKQTI